MPSTRMIVQIDSPGAKLDFATARQRLAGTGVELDETYGIVCINPQLGRYALRGSGDEQVKAALRALDGVQIFADPSVAPLGRS